MQIFFLKKKISTAFLKNFLFMCVCVREKVNNKSASPWNCVCGCVCVFKLNPFFNHFFFSPFVDIIYLLHNIRLGDGHTNTHREKYIWGKKSNQI